MNRNQTILKQREAANKRIWTLLGMPGGDPSARQALGKYGLGNKRTLEQLKAFTGINLHNRTTTGNRCGNIDWVPWDHAEHGWASEALDHLHNSVGPPSSIADDLAKEIYRGEQFVEQEAHLVAHKADIAEAFIAREAHLLAHEAQFVGSELHALELRAAQHLPLPEDEGVSVLTALVGLFLFMDLVQGVPGGF